VTPRTVTAVVPQFIAARGRKCADIIGTVLVPWFLIKYTETILSIFCTPKLLWFEITKMLADCSLKNKFLMSFLIIFDTLSFPRKKEMHTYNDLP